MLRSLKPATLLKRRFHYRFFLVNIAKVLRTYILKNIRERLLLTMKTSINTKIYANVSYSADIE